MLQRLIRGNGKIYKSRRAVMTSIVSHVPCRDSPSKIHHCVKYWPKGYHYSSTYVLALLSKGDFWTITNCFHLSFICEKVLHGICAMHCLLNLKLKSSGIGRVDWMDTWFRCWLLEFEYRVTHASISELYIWTNWKVQYIKDIVYAFE